MCILTPEVQCLTFHQNHIVWQTKIKSFSRNGNDSKQAYSAGQTVHLQIKAEQKEIIQNVLERKDSMAECYTGNGLRKEHVLRPPFLDKVLHFFSFLMVICNSLNLLLKSLPINIINCIKFDVNCSALTGAYDWQ